MNEVANETVAEWTLTSVFRTQLNGNNVTATLELERGEEACAVVDVLLFVDADYGNHETSLGDLVIESDVTAEVRAWLNANADEVSSAVYEAA